MIRTMMIIGGALAIWLSACGNAHAYLDPGTGSMIVQALIAAVAAVGVTFGIFKRRIKEFWGKLLGRDHDV